MSTPVDILMLGFCSWDYVGIVPRIPHDDKVRMGAYVEQGGGPAGTAAVAAARLGARTGFASRVGPDARGRLILDEFRREGVDVSRCREQKDAISPAGFCWVEEATGYRSIAWYPGTIRPLTGGDLDETFVRGVKVLHLDGHHPEAIAVAARQARDAGTVVSLDAGTYGEHMPGVIELCHVVIASEGFAARLIGRDDPEAAVRDIAARGPHTAAVTRGSRGAVCLAGGRLFQVPAFPVQAVDTTGAGDVFHGAYCVALLEGWPVEKNFEFASAAAALKCTRLGGRTAIPRREEVLMFLQSKGSHEWKS